MLERFTGTSGAAALTEAMLEQRLVQHDQTLASAFIAGGTLAEHAVGDLLVSQGDGDDAVFFIITGEVAIEVNGRTVATRSATESVGEMAAADPTAPRSASVRVTTTTVTLRVAAAEFTRIANSSPVVWRAVARVVGGRLRQRDQFHRLPNHRPVLFVGSSVEGLTVAKHVQLALKHEPVEVRLWTDGVFGPSGVAVDKLLTQVRSADFALFVFGPDDRVASRDVQFLAPRDNVVLELGMFLSCLGRERTFMLKEQASDLKVPTDLLGVTPVTYVAAPGVELEVVLGPACTELAKQLRRMGSI